jgi:acyl-CoA synthetase (NDP forming)
VAVDLRDADAVAEAFARIGGTVIVQPMISGGIELLCGLVQDPVFGTVVALSAGGILAELSGPANVRVAPITDVDADELVTSGTAGMLLAGARGASPGDASAVADVLHRLSALGDDLPEVVELDLNPVIVLARGCVVVDARVRVAAPAPVRSPRTW